MTPEDAAALQVAYDEDRRDYAEAIGRPYPPRSASVPEPQPTRPTDDATAEP